MQEDHDQIRHRIISKPFAATAAIVATLHFLAVLECASMVFEYDFITVPLQILLFPHWLLLKSQLTWPLALFVSGVWGVSIAFIAQRLIARWPRLRIIGVMALVCVVLSMGALFVIGSMVARSRNTHFVH